MSREFRYAKHGPGRATNTPGLVQDAITGVSYQVASDGTRTALGGGGSQPPTDHAQYNAVAAVADGDLVEWDPVRDPLSSDGRELLDFTDPIAPTVLIAGVYSCSVWMQGITQEAGKRIRLDFEMVSTAFESEGALDGIGVQNPTLSVNGTWHMNIGNSLFCAVNHDVGAPYGVYRLYVQLVSEDAP